LIQSGAHAGYARIKLVGHQMDWLFVDKPALNELVEYDVPVSFGQTRHPPSCCANPGAKTVKP
jgi:hypothetical protein